MKHEKYKLNQKLDIIDGTPKEEIFFMEDYTG